MKLFSSIILIFSLLLSFNLDANICGKFDCGHAYVHLDILESNRTVERIDLPAAKIDINVVITGGWLLKPTFLYGKNNGHNNGELLIAGIGLGHCFPIQEKWSITPSVGVTYTDIHTDVHLTIPEMGRLKFKEEFESTAPYVALEATYKIIPCLRLSGLVQYAWSRSHTTIKNLLKSKNDSKGPNYGLMLEYDLNDCMSVNIAAGYNISLSKEKHGIRGRGIKMGFVYWFGT